MSVALTIMVLTVTAAAGVTAQVPSEPDPLKRFDVLAVRTGNEAKILLAAPPRTTTQSLTGADVTVQVDGRESPARLQRLPVGELDLAVVVDTSVPIGDLRAIQGAIVQLALALPQGTTMRIADATGAVAAPAPVPGPAIAQIRQLAAETGTDLQRGVAGAKAALNTSTADRSVMLVIGRDLGNRLTPLGGRGRDRLHQLIDIGATEADGALLGPRAAGDVTAVDDADRVLSVTDRLVHNLGNLYRATVDLPAGGADTVTLRIAAGGGDGPARTLALEPDSIRPVDATAPDAAGPNAEAADAAPADVGQADAAVAAVPVPASGSTGVTLSYVVLPALITGALLLVLAAVWLSARLSWRRLRPRWQAAAAGRAAAAAAAQGHGDDRATAYEDAPAGPRDGRRRPASGDAPPTTTRRPKLARPQATPDADAGVASGQDRVSAAAAGPTAGTDRASGAGARRPSGARRPNGGDTPAGSGVTPGGDGGAGRRRRRPAQDAGRPIAKLSPQTREALAHAHRGLRRLALASRAAVDSVPDDLFRLTEARASVALSRQDVGLEEVLLSTLAGDEDADVALIRRTAAALSTGWQHTSHRSSAPPPIIEINAVLSGSAAPGASTRGPRRPVAPVRALNPLVEIGLEHIVLARHPERDSELVARAVTATDIMRAARLARPALAISPRLLEERAGYHAALDADLNDAEQRDRWLQLLCGCIARAATDSTAQLERLDRLREWYRARAPDTRMLPMVDLLLARPIIDAQLVRRHLSTSGRTTTRLLTDAERAGWIRRDGRRTGTWYADQVLSLFSSDAREHHAQPA